MRVLVEADPGYKEVILPYIGGEEVNSSPTHSHHRYVINFGERSEEECRSRWPDLMAIVEAKVKPERMVNNREGYRRYWWQYAEKRVDLFAAIGGLDRVLSCTLHSKDLSFSFLPSVAVYSHALAVFPLSSYAAFCA